MSDQKYVYRQSEPGLYTVGFYDPAGRWVAETDHADWLEAAKRVNFLNGAIDANIKHNTLQNGGAVPEWAMNAGIYKFPSRTMIPLDDAVLKINGHLEPDTGRILSELKELDLTLIEKLNERYDSESWINLQKLQQVMSEVALGGTVSLPTAEFDSLLEKVLVGLLNPENKAALAQARISLQTLRDYSPTTLAKEMPEGGYGDSVFAAINRQHGRAEG